MVKPVQNLFEVVAGNGQKLKISLQLAQAISLHPQLVAGNNPFLARAKNHNANNMSNMYSFIRRS